jgi:DNA repair exonuclease SbcCD nuclease subunit
MNSYTVCENGVESNSLLDKSSNIYSGHFHKYQENKYKNGSIKYVGSPYQHNYGDVGNTNGYHILDVSTGECKFYENAISPKFVYAYLSKYEGLDENNIKSNFVKLFVDKDADEKTINKAICYFEKFNPKEFVVDSIDKNPFNDVEIKNNLDSIDVFDTILEYIDTLDIDNVQKKVTIIQKIKEYYEKYNNK